MEYLHQLSSLAAIWLVAAMVPGPNFVLVTRRALGDSRPAALASALGVSVGAVGWATAAMLGLRTLFTIAPWLYTGLRWVGGAYLVYLGVRALYMGFRGPVETNSCPGAMPRAMGPFRQGLLTSFSNPKTAAFFGSMFGTMLPPHAPAWVYLAALGLILAISSLWYGTVACFLSHPGPRAVYETFRRPMDVLTGGLFTYVGARLALTDPGA